MARRKNSPFSRWRWRSYQTRADVLLRFRLALRGEGPEACFGTARSARCCRQRGPPDLAGVICGHAGRGRCAGRLLHVWVAVRFGAEGDQEVIRCRFRTRQKEHQQRFSAKRTGAYGMRAVETLLKHKSAKRALATDRPTFTTPRLASADRQTDPQSRPLVVKIYSSARPPSRLASASVLRMRHDGLCDPEAPSVVSDRHRNRVVCSIDFALTPTAAVIRTFNIYPHAIAVIRPSVTIIRLWVCSFGDAFARLLLEREHRRFI